MLGGVWFLASATGGTHLAQAQTNCAAVRAELTNLVNGGGGGRTAELQRTLNQQYNELARAQNAYDRLSCGFRASGQCNAVVNAITQMQSNIATIERRIQRAGGGGNQRRIRELERVFATQCGPNQRRQQQAAAPARPVDSLLSAIFGVRSEPPGYGDGNPSRVVRPGDRRRGFDRPGQESVREPVFRSRGNTYRTMCVRTTDGFYWPISFSTTRDRFDEDQGLCAAMCPGTAVELFAYRNPGEQVEAMVSTLSGESYTSRPYAFAYRSNFDPDNRCTPSANVLEDLRGPRTASAEPASPTVPQPMARPSLEDDPETRALAAAGADFRSLASMSAQARGDQQLVRLVGPSYGYFTE